MKRAYLAGPEVFLPDPIAEGVRKKEICAKYGLEGVYPLDTGLDLTGLSPQEMGYRISAANEDLIRGCDLLIANITPFRGPSADVGTAFEIGFARALGKPVFAYTNVLKNFRERTREFVGKTKRRANGDLEDDKGMLIESMALWDNLMIDGAIRHSGGSVAYALMGITDIYRDLANFETCVEKAALLVNK